MIHHLNATHVAQAHADAVATLRNIYPSDAQVRGALAALLICQGSVVDRLVSHLVARVCVG